ncbi:MAG: dockerin type I repeat-containing protein [Porcipelethomonas sp.]
MKRKLKNLFTAAVCIGTAACSVLNASAETIYMEPEYEFHGNMCGEIILTPAIDRNICITVTQITEDGNYKYYDSIIPASGEEIGKDSFVFAVEGKDNVKYRMDVGVPEYRNSEDYQMCSYEFTVSNTEYIEDEIISKYAFVISVGGSEETEAPAVFSAGDPLKDENNIITRSVTFEFPVSEVIPGDVDMNNIIDVFDAIAIAQYTVGKQELSDVQIKAADINADGNTDVFDAIFIAKKTVE